MLLFMIWYYTLNFELYVSYELMRECWHLDPSHRPNPHDIVVQLTPSESIFDDADSEINDGQFVSSKITSSNNSAGHQSCKINITSYICYHSNSHSIPYI